MRDRSIAILARVLTLALLIALVACTPHDSRCVELPGGGHYCLQPTATMAPFDAQQKIDVSINNQHETMIAQIESDSENLRFVGLTPLGQKLIQVNYDNRTVTATTTSSTPLDPAMLIAMLQIALWPTDAVRLGLSTKLTLQETNNSRRILSGSNVLLTVNHIGTQLPYQQLHLTIPSLSIELDIENINSYQ